MFNTIGTRIKIIIIASLTLIMLFLISCQSEQDIIDLKTNITQLTIQLEDKEKQLINFNTLTKNLNKLLSTVYYGYAEPIDGGREINFTAFSMFYNGNFYLVTAGHCIENKSIRYDNFKFKPNNSKIWIYPKLIYYEADYKNNRDFAIFVHSSINKGLIIDQKDKKPKYVLGNTKENLNLFKEFKEAAEGESGSPILSSGCKLIGIVIKNNIEYTPIEAVTDAMLGKN